MVCINSKQTNKIIKTPSGAHGERDTEEMFIIRDLQNFDLSFTTSARLAFQKTLNPKFIYTQERTGSQNLLLSPRNY